MKSRKFIVVLVSSLAACHLTLAFEGRVSATLTQSGDAQNLLYTAGTNFLRIERLESDQPYARDIVNLQSGEITLLFQHNQSFVRLEPASAGASGAPPGFPAMPAMPRMPAMPNM